MSNEITPAIQLDHGKPLSAEEFQKGLFDYFEDKGIMADLRAHLRAQMIKALRQTTMGTDFNKNHDISPKLQAVNLLIAEYLLQKDYHYSLSVFSTEVPLNKIFPAFSDKENLIKFKFSESDMWDILETLGFLQANQNARTISTIYKTNSSESLLNCIIKTTHLGQHQEFDYIKHITSEIRSEKLSQEELAPDGLDEFLSFIKETNLQPETTIKIIDLLKVIITNEMRTVHEAKMEEIMMVRQKMQIEANEKLDKYKRKLHAMEVNYKKERKRLEGELEKAKCNLRECAQSLQNKYREINNVEDNLRTREKQLINQAEVLNEKEKLLQKQLEDVVTEKMSLKELQSDFERKSLREQSSKQTEDRGQQTLDNLNLENTLLKHNVKHQQQQIDALREQNLSYLSRIQDLALKTTTLMQQLENSQQRVNELNNLQNRSVIVPPPIVVSSVPTGSYRSSYGIASYNGGGEEGSNVAPLPGRHFKNVSFNKELKRKKCHIQIENSSSSDDLSPTDTVLREAKERLQNLEKESDQIDKHYDGCAQSRPNILQDFQQNLESIRKSISRIFNYNQPGTSSALTNTSNVSFKTAYNEDKAGNFRIKDFPDDSENIRRQFTNDNETIERHFSDNTGKTGRQFIDDTEDIGTQFTHSTEQIARQFTHDTEQIGRQFTDDTNQIGRDFLINNERLRRNLTEQSDALHLKKLLQDKSEVLKIKNLIAELPEDLKRQDYEDVLNNFGTHEKPLSMPSLNSSGVLLGASFSTVELSTDFKSDESPRTAPNGGSSRRSSGAVTDNVAISCLFAFMLEMYLLK